MVNKRIKNIINRFPLLAGTIILLLLTFCAFAYGETEGDYTYEVIDGGVKITAYAGPGGDLVIPDILGELPVLEIGNNAFQDKQLTSVTIPNSVTSIGESAFHYNQLVGVTIPEGIKSIRGWAFSYNQLTNVIIPDSVISIGDSAFQGNQLASVIIPDNVMSIGESAFDGNKLTSVTIPNSVTSIADSAFRNNALGSVIIGTNVTSIGYCAFANNQLTRLTIPNSVTSIGENAFTNNLLTNISIPDSVRSIGNFAFSHNKLTGLIIPNGITTIGPGVFSNNELTSVTISDNITSIGMAAFKDNLLDNVIIGNKVVSIGHSAFYNNLITDLTIGNAVQNIDVYAFYNNRLTTLTIPDSVTLIDALAFQYNRLTSLTIGSGVISIGNSAFENNQLTSLTIPDSVTSIGEYAFRENKLTSVIIPKTVTNIGNSAFQDNLLTSVTIHGTTITLGNYLFRYNPIDLILYGLAGSSVEIYAINNHHQFVAISPTVYNVTINPSAHGIITSDKNEAELDELVILTVTPNTGYELDSLKLNGVAQVLTSNIYTFQMPGENIVVDATFKSINNYTGTITINYHDTDGNIIKTSDVHENVGGIITYCAPDIIGYKLVDGQENTVTFDITEEGQVFKHTFVYQVTTTVTYTITVETAVNGSVNGAGTYYTGATVTLSAISNSGYNFDGWYEGEIKVSSLPEYSFIVTKDIVLTPMFKAMPKGYLEVTTVGGGSVKLNDLEYLPANYKMLHYQDADITLTATADSGYEFAYWENGLSSSILSTSETYTTILGTGINAKAVFNRIPTEATTYFNVIFKDKSSKILQSTNVNKNAAAIAPPAPAISGYDFIGWNQDFNNVTAPMIITAVYEREAQKYTLNVEGGTISTGGTSGEYQFDWPVTVVANSAPDGQKFSHWEKDDAKVSTKSSFSFFMPQHATTLAAVFADEDTILDNSPFITLSPDVLVDHTNRIIMFTAIRNIPADYTLVESGVLLFESDTALSEDLTIDTASVIRGKINNDSTDQFYIRKTNVSERSTWYGRAYMIYEDANGNLVTVYSENTENAAVHDVPEDPQPLAIGTVDPPDAAQNQAYAGHAFTASGGTAPYSYAITDGSLPAGMSVSTDGYLSGTPTLSGTFDFTVMVTDSKSATALHAFTLTVSLEQKGWTIMFYNNGESGTEEFNMGDIAEAKAGITNDVNMVVLIDCIPGYSSDSSILGEDFTDTRLYHITPDTATRIGGSTQFPEITTTSDYEANMTDANTLKKFVQFGKANYPADNYALIIHDHGSGARSIGVDSTNGGTMYIAEITDVLSANESVDLLFLQSCQMGTAEVAYQYRPGNGSFAADVMVASAPTTWIEAFDYQAILSRLNSNGGNNGQPDSTMGGLELIYDPVTLTAQQFGGIIVEEMSDKFATVNQRDRSIACYDLGEVGDVKTALDALARDIYSKSKKSDLEAVRGYGSDAVTMRYFVPGIDQHWRDYPYFDLYDLCRGINNNTTEFDSTTHSLAAEVITAVDNMIVYSYGGNSYSGFTNGQNGLSVFFPDGDRLYHSKNMWTYQYWYNSIDVIAWVPSFIMLKENYYGKLKWCIDGQNTDANSVGNWFEMLDAWYDPRVNDANGGCNGYQW